MAPYPFRVLYHPAELPPAQYYWQLSASQVKAYAEESQQAYGSKLRQPVLLAEAQVGGQLYYKVLVGPFVTAAAAKLFARSYELPGLVLDSSQRIRPANPMLPKSQKNVIARVACGAAAR